MYVLKLTDLKHLEDSLCSNELWHVSIFNQAHIQKAVMTHFLPLIFNNTLCTLDYREHVLCCLFSLSVIHPEVSGISLFSDRKTVELLRPLVE